MIDFFKDDYAFLSNFYDAPLTYDGRRYRNSEGAYQAAKFIQDAQMNIAPWQFENLSGAQAKKLAKENKQFIRPDWQDVSLRVMSEIVHAKFAQNKDLRILLVNTFPNDLIEGNYWHDQFYGDCRCGKKLECAEKGRNWLGRLLESERMYWIHLMSGKSWEGAVLPHGKSLGSTLPLQSPEGKPPADLRA